MKKIVVTGANGYLGRYCIPLLLKKGYEVHAFSKGLLPSHSQQKNVIWHTIDLLNESPEALLKKISPSHLLHLAWVTEHGKFWSSPANHDWLKASISLLKAFQAAGGHRFVTSGTCAEYDWTYGKCIEGVTPEKPASLYGQSKKAFTDHLLADAKNEDFSAVCGRVFFLYGGNEPRQKLVPSIIHTLLEGGVAPCSNGTQTRDFMYVADVADALVALTDSSVQGVVNIASGKPLSIRELVTELSKLLGAEDRVQFGAIARPADDPEILIAATERLNREVQWQPNFSLQQGFVLTIEEARSTLTQQP